MISLRSVLFAAALGLVMASAGCQGKPQPPAVANKPAPPAVAPRSAEQSPPEAAPSEPAAADATDESNGAESPETASAAETAAPVEPQESAVETPSATPEDATPVPQALYDRILLLAPGGPLVIDVEVTIDGRPHPEALEKLVDQVLEMADTNGDGQPTWEELTQNPRFRYGQLGNLAVNNEGERMNMINLYDTSPKNGKVDRDEVPRLLTRNAGGSRSLSLRGGSLQAATERWNSPLRKLLDVDGDGALSAEELAEAPRRLRLYDADDNEIIVPADYRRATPGPSSEMEARRGSGPPAARLLDERTNWGAALYELEEMYSYRQPLDPLSFPLVGGLFSALDANQDETIDRHEVAALATIEPHLRLAIAVGRRADGDGETSQPEIQLTWIAEDLSAASRLTQTPRRIVLEIPGAEVVFYVNDMAPQVNADEQAVMQLAALDKDQNGYLDREEIEQAPPGAFAAFEALDLDGDGSVYREELAEYFRQQGAATRSQVRARATDSDDPLFAVLDADNDGRLTAPEIAAAAERLASLDHSGDGYITAGEAPASLTIGFVRGDPQQGEAIFVAPSDGPRAPEAPDWFAAMDANRDGVISRREFLGSSEIFASLDRNGDGFVDVEEAKAQ